MKTVRAPFTGQQVEALSAFQELGYIHPFTCKYYHPNGRILHATEVGWQCVYPGCDYIQDWAYEYMADKSLHPRMPSKLKKS